MERNLIIKQRNPLLTRHSGNGSLEPRFGYEKFLSMAAWASWERRWTGPLERRRSFLAHLIGVVQGLQKFSGAELRTAEADS
jgi:hypothetical protein